MSFFMALTPPDDALTGGSGRATSERLEKAVILKDGFSLPAFLLTGMWLLYKRLWVPFALFVLIWLALGFGLPRLGLPEGAVMLAQLVIGLFLGHEGHALLERKLVRTGWRLAGVVEARDMDAAERRFFELALLERQPAPDTTSLPVQRVFGTPAGNPIIGLFPQALGR